jgi:hypothetical protein
MHWPVAEQLSAVGVAPVLQALQLAPAGPQAVVLRLVHVPLLQQPEGHEVASQTHSPLTHR